MRNKGPRAGSRVLVVVVVVVNNLKCAWWRWGAQVSTHGGVLPRGCASGESVRAPGGGGGRHEKKKKNWKNA